MIEMHLQKESFENIKNGIKDIELRINDIKRQKIEIGDTICFINLEDSKDLVMTKVVGLSRFLSFEDLFFHLDPYRCGGEKGKSINSMIVDTRKFYSLEEEQKYGVVGIHLKLI